MSISALITDLVAAGVSAELVGRVAEALASREPVIIKVTDEQAERRREKDRERKANVRRLPQTSAESADSDPAKESLPHTPSKKTTSSLRSDVSLQREREEFCDKAWRLVPKRRGDAPKPFKDSIRKALVAGVPAERIAAGLARYVEAERDNPEPQFRKGAAVWANGHGWEADYSQPARAGPSRFAPRRETSLTRDAGYDREDSIPPDDFNGTTLDLAATDDGRSRPLV